MDYQTVLVCCSMPLPGTIHSRVYKRTQTLTWLSSSTASAYTQHTAPPRHYLGESNAERVWCSTTSSKSSWLPAPGMVADFPVLGRSASGGQEPFHRFVMMPSCAQHWCWRCSCQILRTRCLRVLGNESPRPCSPVTSAFCELPHPQIMVPKAGPRNIHAH